jgi:hypothetical protein
VSTPIPPLPLEPATWYELTAECRTEDCSRYGIPVTLPEQYSNDGIYIPIQCAPCTKLMLITEATKLDPQPVPE